MKALLAVLLLAGPLLAACDKGADPATAKGAPRALAHRSAAAPVAPKQVVCDFR